MDWVAIEAIGLVVAGLVAFYIVEFIKAIRQEK